MAALSKPYSNAYSTRIYLEGEVRLLKEILRDPEGKRLLKLDLFNEVFNTSILFWICSHPIDVFALDISRVLVAKANSKLKQDRRKARLLAADMRAIPFEDSTFDYIYTMGTIEHVPEDDLVVQEIHRVLKPGGSAIIGVPNRWDPFLGSLAVWAGNRLGFLPYGDEKCYSWNQLRCLLERNHLMVVKRGGVYFLPWFIRFADIWLFTHLYPIDGLLRPLLWIFGQLSRIPALRRFSRLMAAVVKKADVPPMQRASRPREGFGGNGRKQGELG